MKNNIASRLDYYKQRVEPEKKTKYKAEIQTAKHLTKTKEVVDYHYYTCDYCGAEIRVLKNEKVIENNNFATGGLVRLPLSLTGCNSIFYLALCNKCVNPVRKELDQAILEKRNINHIPRID